MTIIKRKNKAENGFTLLELVVVIGIISVLAVGGSLAYSDITEKAMEASENKNCEAVNKEVTNDLVKYIEEYNVNNPNDRLGDFTIKSKGNYESKSHPNQESDPKFSLLISKTSTCSSYKFETLKGDHFTISSSNPVNKKSTSQESWTPVYDSRQS